MMPTILSAARNSMRGDPESIEHVIAEHAECIPAAGAIAWPDGATITYARLARDIEMARAQLRVAGYGPQHRIGVVLPTGPDLAATCLAVTCACVCAPLSDVLQHSEYVTAYTELKLDAVVVARDAESPAVEAAQQLNLPMIAFRHARRGFDESALLVAPALPKRPVDADIFGGIGDLAVLMLTSGTTARPKCVPLSHRNLCASARSTIYALRLTEADRGLNLAPLFHIHGFSIAFASVLAGAEIVCPKQIEVENFYSCLNACHPTWYVAGPAMHGEIAATATSPDYADIVARSRLRFIRSGSAALPRQVLERLESVFRAPVLEAYGMTETAPLIACNPLPPEQRKPGSVGLPAGCEVALVDAVGAHLGRGEEGEIVVRGDNVMARYVGDAQATADSFVDGWFRTGDLGYLDEDGYLFLTGRLKEIINRGGQKVSPYEVEATLCEHPAVRAAVVFAAPHASLGEQVAAGIVLRQGCTCRRDELIAFASERLAPFKVPRSITFLDTIPVTKSGKLQRIGLAKRLQLSDAELHEPGRALPRSATEKTIARIWANLLECDAVSVTDDFYALGGNSLLATRMLDEVGRERQHVVPRSIFFALTNATIEGLASALDSLPPVHRRSRAGMVAVRSEGSKQPFIFLAADHSYYASLSRHLDMERPLYVLEPHEVYDLPVPLSIEAMAADHIASLQQRFPRGPYLLGGYSTGALVAFEMACRLRDQGHAVDGVILVDSTARNAPLTFLRPLDRLGRSFVFWGNNPTLHLRAAVLGLLRAAYLMALTPKVERHSKLKAMVSRLVNTRLKRAPDPNKLHDEKAGQPYQGHLQWVKAYKRAVAAYLPEKYPGRLSVIVAEEAGPLSGTLPAERWRYVSANLRIVPTPGTHRSCVREHLPELAQRLEECLGDH